jgi:hypothetical protein
MEIHMAIVNGNPILPGDEDWYIPDSEDFMISAQAVVGKDAFVFSTQLEGELHSLADPYSRFYRYEQGKWVCVVVEATITGLALYRDRGWQKEGLAVLGQEGDLWLLDDGFTREFVGGPGESLDYKRGFLTTLKVHGDELFVTGMDGQFYRRKDGVWRHDDAGMLKMVPTYPRMRPTDAGKTAWIEDVVTPDGRTFYACGTVSLWRPALFWRTGDEPWRWIGLNEAGEQFDFMQLVCMLAEPDGSIWIATDNGILLKGDGRNGFRVATDVARYGTGHVDTLSELVKYGESIYAAGAQVYRLVDGRHWDVMTGPPSKSIYQSESGETFIPGGVLQAVDGILWVFGVRSVSRFDGTQWDCIEIPELYKTPR